MILLVRKSVSATGLVLYEGSAYDGDWSDGFSAGSGSRSKESDHLYLLSEGGSPSGERSYVTNTKVDLTEYSDLKVDWALTQEVGAAVAHLIVDSRDGYDAVERGLNEGVVPGLNDYGPFTRTTTTLDVSGKSGGHFVRLHSFAGHHLSDRKAHLYVYKVWLE